MSKRAPLTPDRIVFPAIAKSAAPLRQQVLDGLRDSIVHGRLAPGERLVERELIDLVGVSRTVIREVLRQLESEGLIHVVPNKGAVVRQLSLADARDLYAIRGVLEGLAARLFVDNADKARIRQLEEALATTIESYRGGDPDRILATKNSFYEILFAGSGSETLSSMLTLVHARIWRWRALGLAHPRRSRQRSKESIAGLRALVGAIKEGDAAGAETVARQEVANAAAEIVRLLESEGGEITPTLPAAAPGAR
jgi:GntR family transcriptional regulator, trigonelline degradation regulator